MMNRVGLGRMNQALLLVNVLFVEVQGHPSSTCAKLSEKLTFLTPWYAPVRMCIRGLEMLVFRKVLRTYLMDDPFFSAK